MTLIKYELSNDYSSHYFNASNASNSSEIYENKEEVSSEKVFNFFFHPLDEDHSPLVKTCSVLALAFLSLLSGGIYVVVFVYVNRRDLINLDQLNLPYNQEHYSTNDAQFETLTLSTQETSRFSVEASNLNEQLHQESTSTANSLPPSQPTMAAETQKQNTANNSDNDCYTNEFSEVNSAFVEERMKRLSRFVATTRAPISLDSAHREGPNCVCDRCDSDIALQLGYGFAIFDHPQHLRGASSTEEGQKPPYAQFKIHHLADTQQDQ